MRLRPKRSPSAPPVSISAERNSEYASTTHCTSSSVAFIRDCRAGNAMLTTVPSMKAMLDPRMVAARIHGPDSREHGVAARPDLICASAHGFLRVAAMSLEVGYVSQAPRKVDVLYPCRIDN